MNDYVTMKQSPVIEDVPFMHPAAWLYLESLLTKDMTVMEHGCGASTVWFAKRVKKVIAYDTQPEWIAATKNALSIWHYADASVVLGGLTEAEKFGSQVDLLLIDGTPIQDRSLWMLQSLKLVRPGGIVVIDNVDKGMHEKARQWLWNRCAMGVTITANPPRLRNYVTDFLRLRGGVDTI